MKRVQYAGEGYLWVIVAAVVAVVAIAIFVGSRQGNEEEAITAMRNRIVELEKYGRPISSSAAAEDAELHRRVAAYDADHLNR